MSTDKIISAAFCAALLCSCTQAKQNGWFVSHNGNMPSEERISQIQKGSSRDDVLRVLGAPSAVVSFDDNTWIYMSSDIKRVAFFKPEEIDRDLMKIKFNQEGQVIEIARLTEEDGQKLTPSADQTPVRGEKLGFFRKYFGGVGQYNPFAGKNSAGGL